MLRTANSDLDTIYNYYLDLQERFFNPDDKYDSLKNINDDNEQFFYFLIAFYGKNKFPKVISDSDWNNVRGIKTYHGFRKPEHGANFLWDTIYHYGQGTLCLGFFTTTSYEEASDYAYYHSRAYEPLEMKIPLDNIIELDDLNLLCDTLYRNKKDLSNIKIDDDRKQKFLQIREFINSKKDNFFKRIIIDNPTSLALLLGYDTVKMSMCNDTYVVVLNRGNIYVQESDVRRFLNSAGGEYKNFTYLIKSRGGNENDRT